MDFQRYLIEASKLFGKDFLCEKETINKIYLSKQAGSEESYKEVKAKVDKLWNDDHMSTYIKKSETILPFLYSQEIKKKNSITKDVMKFLHDLSSAGKLNVLGKLDSDTTPEEFKDFIKDSIKDYLKGGLTPEQETIWKRVKVFHKFDDGFEWVIALDDKGEICSYIPSNITQKTAAHCGNEPSKEDGDQYFELRKNNKPYLTVIINDGKIEESKSYGNQRNKDTDLILSHYKWLLSHEHVTGVGRRYNKGYAPDMNMGLKDFLGKDDEFIAHMEKTKPDLMGEIDKVIIDLKRQFEAGKITEEDLIKMLKDKEIKLWELRGVLGRVPFTENELIEMIDEYIIDDQDISNTDTKLLTIPVQHALVDSDNYGHLINAYNFVPTAKIDIKYILEHDDDILEYIVLDKRLDLVLKFRDIFDKLFFKSPDSVRFLNDPDDIMKILKEFKPTFEQSFTNSGGSTLRYLPKDRMLEIANMFKEFFEKLVKMFPVYALQVTSFEDAPELIKMFKKSFEEAFNKTPSNFRKLGETLAGVVIGEIDSLEDLYDKYYKFD